MKIIEQLSKKLEELYKELENGDHNAEQDIIDLEEEIKERISEYDPSSGKDKQDVLYKLLDRIKNIKEEFDFYDEEAELNMMFPDRDDEDFDEDNISWGNVFGED